MYETYYWSIFSAFFGASLVTLRFPTAILRGARFIQDENSVYVIAYKTTNGNCNDVELSPQLLIRFKACEMHFKWHIRDDNDVTTTIATTTLITTT